MVEAANARHSYTIDRSAGRWMTVGYGDSLLVIRLGEAGWREELSRP